MYSPNRKKTNFWEDELFINYLWSIILGYAGAIVFFIVFSTSVMPDIIQGRDPDFEDIFFSSLILIISLIPIILFITNLSTSGTKLSDSILEYSPRTRYSFIYPKKLKNMNLSGQLTAGGIVITPDKKNKKILILGSEDIAHSLSYNEAEQLSKMQININGYTDWFLPNKEEMQQIFLNLNNEKESNVLKGKYWVSKTTGSSPHHRLHPEYKKADNKLYMFDFDTGKVEEQDPTARGKVRLMRIEKFNAKKYKSQPTKATALSTATY